MIKDNTADRHALDLLKQLSAPDSAGYVTLNSVPYRAHHLLLREALRVTNVGDRVFEGGVSSGYFARALVEAGRRVDGHELDPVAAASARKVCGTIHEGDLQNFDPSGIPDDYALVMFGDTLEHIARPEEVLARLRPHIRPGGHLIVSVPNVANWSVRLQLLSGRFRYTDRGILDRTHLRWFTRATLAELIESAGFEIKSNIAAVPVPGVTSKRLTRITHTLGNLAPGLMAYIFVVTAQRT